MTFKEKWQRLPRWLRMAVYTVLGTAAMAGVGYLGFRLTRLLVGVERMNVFWGAAGALILINVVLGGLDSGGCFRMRRRQDKTAD